MVQNVYEEINAAFDAAAGTQTDAKTIPASAAGTDELSTMTGEQLMDYPFQRREYLVDGLLQDGLTVLAGAPKVGKSWLVLHLCLQVCKGSAFLGNAVKRSDVLYLALEDTPRRLRERMSLLTEDCGSGLYLATGCQPLGDGLIKQLSGFIGKHPLTRLIVIDTFQKVRSGVRELSYANDYADVSRLKKLADDNGICIMLVHHTRKLADNDYMNEISGTNGIAGSADALMVLKRESRSSRSATLSCTGRDIEDRELKLSLDRESCVWQVKADSRDQQDWSLPEELRELVEYMKEIGSYEGSNTAFVNGFCSARGYIIDASHLKFAMNRYRDELAEAGVEFISARVNKQRVLGVVYHDPQPEQTSAAPIPDLPDASAREVGDQNAERGGEGCEPAPLLHTDREDEGALCRDDDYMNSLLSDEAYPRTSLSELDMEEEALWRFR